MCIRDRSDVVYNSSGDVIYTKKVPGLWEAVIPGTWGESIMKFMNLAYEFQEKQKFENK